jgi:hypothetical protein
MSRELADVVGRSILATLDLAEKYPTPESNPKGAFGRDLEAIATAPAGSAEVRGRLHAILIDTVGMFLAHAIDHTRALANDMNREPVPVWSPLTLCRAVQESTVWMCHLLDPPASTETRLCRIAALWIDDSQPARTAASTFGSEHAADVDAHHQFKLTELTAGGLTVDLDARQRPVRVRLETARAQVGLNLTDEVTKLTPTGAPSPYRPGSGAAHSRPWMLERSATKTRDGQLVGEGATAGTAALTVMICMLAWVSAWGGYFGLDVTQQLEEMRSTMTNFARHGVALA